VTNPRQINVPAESAGQRVGLFLGDTFPLESEDLARALLAGGKVTLTANPPHVTAPCEKAK